MIKRTICTILVFCMMSATANSAFALVIENAEDRTVSEAGIQFIEKFEGFSGKVYSDSSQWYIGYGTSCDAADYPGGISEEEAEKLLREALKKYETSVNSFLTEHDIDLTQCQFDALVSFTYNVGTSWMDSPNHIYMILTGGMENYTDLEMVNAIGIWCHIGKKVNGRLIERRLAEAKLFLIGNYDEDDAQDYSYIIFDPGSGSMEDDIYFYQSGQPYGTFPETKLDGYIFTGWYTSGGKQIGSNQIAGDSLTVTAGWSGGPISAERKLYSDVTEDDWFYTYVSDLSNGNVISGYPDGTFQPGNSVTCGEALKLILLAAGYDAQDAAGSHWASGYLKLAVSKGLVNAENIPDLNAPISRLLVAQIAAKALGFSKLEIQAPFADTSDGYVLSLYENDIITGGYENGVLVYKPESSITRAEISAVVWRITSIDVQVSQIQCGSYWVDVLKDVPVNSYDAGKFHLADGVMYYNSDKVKTCTGIDVSAYQGEINWQKVKASGVDFAMIRLGYRGYTVGSINLDSCFERNIQGALAAGLDVGVYFFSQAVSVEEAIEEARFVLSYIKGYGLTYPVVFDWEALGKTEARTYGLDTETLCQCANAFCGMMADEGYMPMIYFTSYIGYVKYDLSKVLDYEFWYAQYSDKPSFYYDYQMWQYTSGGTVDGISGNVDMNICFADY